MQERRQPEIVAGRVNADGSIAAGEGFTVNRSSAGVYNIAFGPGFRFIAATVNVAVWFSGQHPPVVDTTGPLAPAPVRVLIYNSTGGSVDGAFEFVAVGVQQ